MFLALFIIFLAFPLRPAFFAARTAKCKEINVASNGVCTLENVHPDFLQYNQIQGHNIKTLYITKSQLTNIPNNINIYIPNLKTLDLSSTGLAELRRTSFAYVPASLENLNISHCQFKNVIQQMFTNIPKLRILDMSYGEIETIHDNAFESLESLTYLNLAGNKLLAVSKNIFGELPSLFTLDLSNNLIRGSLEAGLFGGSQKLRELDLDHNWISNVEDGFVSSNELEFLSLVNNTLTQFNTSSIRVKELMVSYNFLSEIYISSSTVTLHASHNNITELGCDEILSLQVLKLAGNSISSLDCIGKASTLTNLDLRDSNIGPLNHSTFAMLTELKELRLGHTNITKFVLGVLSHQEKLEVLDLSYNKLGSFSLDILLAAKNLKELYIDGNEMMNIPYQKIDEIFHSLQVLGIGDNTFDCSNLAEIFRYFSKRELRIVASSDKVIHSTNIKGIGCTMSNSSLLPVMLPVANSSNLNMILESVRTVQENDRRLESILANVTNRMNEMRAEILDLKEEILDLKLNNSMDSKLLILIKQLNNVTVERQQLNQSLHEIDSIHDQLKQQRYLNEQKSTDSSDISFIKHMLLICIGAALIFIGFKLYEKFKLPHGIRRFSSEPMLTNIEMNSTK